MTRENKAGLVICGSFLCLIAAVVVVKLRQPGGSDAPTASPTASIGGEQPSTEVKAEHPAKSPEPSPDAVAKSSVVVAPGTSSANPEPGSTPTMPPAGPSPAGSNGNSIALPEPPNTATPGHSGDLPPVSGPATVENPGKHPPDVSAVDVAAGPAATPPAGAPPPGPPAAPPVPGPMHSAEPVTTPAPELPAPLPPPPGASSDLPTPPTVPSPEPAAVEHEKGDGHTSNGHSKGPKSTKKVGDGPENVVAIPAAGADAPPVKPTSSGTDTPPVGTDNPSKPMSPGTGEPPLPPPPGPPPLPGPSATEPPPFPPTAKIEPPPPSIVAPPAPMPVPIPPEGVNPAPMQSNVGVIPPEPPAPVGPPPPAPAPVRPAPTVGGSAPLVDSWDEQTYVCKPGDNYASICVAIYKTDKYARALEAYNRNHPRAGDAMRATGAIVPGDKVYVPESNVLEKRHGDMIARPKPAAVGPGSGTVQAGFQTTAAPPPGGTYKVTAAGGEFLAQIAVRLWNDQERWRDLAQLNSGIDPLVPVKAGTVLNLPAAAPAVKP